VSRGKAGGAKFTPAATAKAVGGAVMTAAARGLLLAGENVLGDANALVPIEEGTLERSGAVTVDSRGLRAAVSYGTPYAVVQHEDLTLRHDDGRQAKFLETALTANASTSAEIIASTVRGEIGWKASRSG